MKRNDYIELTEITGSGVEYVVPLSLVIDVTKVKGDFIAPHEGAFSWQYRFVESLDGVEVMKVRFYPNPNSLEAKTIYDFKHNEEYYKKLKLL